MAKVAKKKKVTKKATKKGANKPEYNFDRWLNGKSHTVTQGKEFYCTPKSFVHYVRKQAIARGKHVTCSVEGKKVTIKVDGKYEGVQTNPLQHKVDGKQAKKKKVTKKKSTKKKTTKKRKS